MGLKDTRTFRFSISILIFHIQLMEVWASRDYGDACEPIAGVLSVHTRNPDDVVSCDISKGLYCIPFSGTCGCEIAGTVYREGRCKARVNQQCMNFGAGKENRMLECIKNAVCGPNLPLSVYPGKYPGTYNRQLQTNYFYPGGGNSQQFAREGAVGDHRYSQTYSGVDYGTDMRNYQFNSGGGSFPGYVGPGDHNYPGRYYKTGSTYSVGLDSRTFQPNKGYFPGGNGAHNTNTNFYSNYANSEACLCIPGFWPNLDGTTCNRSGQKFISISTLTMTLFTSTLFIFYYLF